VFHGCVISEGGGRFLLRPFLFSQPTIRSSPPLRCGTTGVSYSLWQKRGFSMREGCQSPGRGPKSAGKTLHVTYLVPGGGGGKRREGSKASAGDNTRGGSSVPSEQWCSGKHGSTEMPRTDPTRHGVVSIGLQKVYLPGEPGARGNRYPGTAGSDPSQDATGGKSGDDPPRRPKRRRSKQGRHAGQRWFWGGGKNGGGGFDPGPGRGTLGQG